MSLEYNTNIHYIDSYYKKNKITHKITFLDGTYIKEYHKIPFLLNYVLDTEFMFCLSYLYICSRYNILE